MNRNNSNLLWHWINIQDISVIYVVMNRNNSNLLWPWINIRHTSIAEHSAKGPNLISANNNNRYCLASFLTTPTLAWTNFTSR